jgi:hypothetical protein
VVGKVLLVDGGRWTLLAVLVGAAVVLARRRALRLGKEALPLAAWLFAGAAFFAVTHVFLARYVLLSLPAFVLLALWLARRAVASDGVFAALAIVVVAVEMSAWHPKRPRTSSFEVQPPEDLGYLDLVNVLAQTSRWLEEKHPGAIVYGGFHEEYALGEPFQGYVTKPFEVVPCRAFAPADGREQLVVVHGYAPEQRRCQELSHSVPARGLRRFEANGKWMEVHRVGSM